MSQTDPSSKAPPPDGTAPGSGSVLGSSSATGSGSFAGDAQPSPETRGVAQNTLTENDGLILRFIAKVALLKQGEGPLLICSAAYAFFLLMAYYVLRPLRDEAGIAAGVEYLPWLVIATLLVTIAVHPVYAWLTSRLPRRRFIPITQRFFMVNLALFGIAFHVAPESLQPYASRAFYVWVSVFNLFAVSVFWSFMSDLYTPEQSKRLFGVIGVGGTLGAIVGAGITSSLASLIGPASLVFVALIFLECSVACVRAVCRRSDMAPSEGTLAAARAREEPDGSPLAGIAAVLRSRYLQSLCAYMMIFTITSTFLYIEQARIVDATYSDPGQRTAFFARIDLLANALTLIVQLFLAGRLLSRLGVGATLALTPIITLAGFAALAASPTIGVLLAVQVIRRGVHYALDRPARAVLFTVLNADEKYKSKSLIDTFVYRTGDMGGAWVYGLGPGVLALSASGIAVVLVPVSLVWIGLAVMLGRGHSVKSRAWHEAREGGNTRDVEEPTGAASVLQSGPVLSPGEVRVG
jgi:ATP:ADP antiporter, AAA family